MHFSWNDSVTCSHIILENWERYSVLELMDLFYGVHHVPVIVMGPIHTEFFTVPPVHIKAVYLVLNYWDDAHGLFSSTLLDNRLSKSKYWYKRPMNRFCLRLKRNWRKFLREGHKMLCGAQTLVSQSNLKSTFITKVSSRLKKKCEFLLLFIFLWFKLKSPSQSALSHKNMYSSLFISLCLENIQNV
jgi:hypothetical protein